MAQKQIFLSHRSSQKAWLKRVLVPSLESVGLDVWLDEREVRLLEPIAREVSQAIAVSHLFLAWWFDGYEDSHHCHFELLTALAYCRAEGEHSYLQRVCFAGPDAARLFPEAGIFQALLAPQLSNAPNQGEIVNLVSRLKDRAMQIDATRPFGASRLEEPVRNTILPNPSFVGRSRELLQILGYLGPRERQEQIAQIVGFAGEGKTELAEEFARRFKFLYPGGIFRINLPGDSGDLSQNELALDSALREFADHLGIAIDEPGASRGRLRHLLSEKLQKPYIWLVNDLPTGISANTIRDCLAPNDFGGSLISSRTEVNGFPKVKIEALPERDGMLLLERLSAERLTTEQREGLYRLVHGHALALNLIGHGVQLGLNVEEFLNPSNPILHALDDLAKIMDSERNGLRSVLSILLTSLYKIPAIGPARRMLSVMAQLAPTLVPREFLCKIFESIFKKPEIDKGILDLLKRGIVTQHDEGSVKFLRIHPFMTEAVRAVPDFVDRKLIDKDLANTDIILKADLENICSDKRYFRVSALSASLLPHSRRRAAEKLALREPDTHFGALVGRALNSIGDLSGARALQARVRDIRNRILGPEHPDTVTSINDLGGTLRSLGDLSDARVLHERALEARRRILGPEELDTLTSMSDLAGTLNALGDLPGARGLQEQVLAIRRRIQGPEHLETLTSMNNLAVTLRSQGDLLGARGLHEQVLVARSRILGPEHPDTLTSMGNLAPILRANGELREARKLGEKVLDARRRILPPDHPDILTSLNNLAVTLNSQNDLLGAEKLYEQVLQARRRTLGPAHPDTLGSINNLAITLLNLGKTAEARDLIRPTLPLLPTLTHADLRKALTALARRLNLLPPEAP